MQQLIKLDPKHLTGDQLNAIRYNLSDYFKDYLPYTAQNGIRFWKGDLLGEIVVGGMGYSVVDNSYNASNDYGLIIYIQRIRHIPEYYRSQIYVDSFSTSTLEKWAKAIMADNKKYKKLL